MGNTFLYALITPILKNILGFALAMIFVQKIKGMNLFRACTYIPYTFSYVVVGVLWCWIYNPTFGLLNAFLRSVGLESWIHGWLSDANIALYSVILVDVWKCMGFHASLFVVFFPRHGFKLQKTKYCHKEDQDHAHGIGFAHIILVYTAQSIAFGMYIMRGFFISLPKSLEEAAMIDGCTGGIHNIGETDLRGMVGAASRHHVHNIIVVDKCACNCQQHTGPGRKLRIRRTKYAGSADKVPNQEMDRYRIDLSADGGLPDHYSISDHLDAGRRTEG